MQNYGHAPGYQQPGSATGFVGQQSAPPPVPPPPPGYGGSQGYQSVAPQSHSQWTTPTPTPTQASNPWNQSQPQAMGGYSPSTYGMMPGGQRQSYAQKQDVPPPPPPKPYGFAAAVQRQEQQQQQNWSQPSQQNANFTSQTSQGGYPNQGTPHQYPYVAPPPPHGGRPSSIYGAVQTSSAPSIPSTGSQQIQASAIPNEQMPAYIPPSMNGQGAQEYMSSNTNPANSTYVPPPPNAPAWQQTQHTPLQGDANQFTYTRPTMDPNSYVQGNQNTQSVYQTEQPPPLPPRVGQQQTGQAQQNQQQYPHYGNQSHPQYPSQTQTPIQPQPASNQYPPQQHNYQQQPYQGQAVSAVHHNQQSFAQTENLPSQYHQQPQQPPYGHAPYDQRIHSPQQAQPQNQWQPPPQPSSAYGHHAAQASHETPQTAQQHSHVPKQTAQEPNSFNQTDSAPSNSYESRPTSQPVSPISNRPSLSFASGHHPGFSRTDSISSIAFNNFGTQRADTKTSSPKPPLQKFSTPPPPRDDKSKFSALAPGGPSDWEHLGGSEEIDDEELFGAKPERKEDRVAQQGSIELPAHVPSPPSTHGFPSPAVYPTHPDPNDSVETYMPTPPPVMVNPSERRSPRPTHEGFIVEDAIVAPLKTTPKPTESPRRPRDHFNEASSPSNQRISVESRLLHEAQAGDLALSVTKPTGPVYSAELKAKDELIDQLQAELQQQIDRRRTELEIFKADREKFESESEAARNHAADERDVLLAQIENMRLTADQASANSEAAAKERGLTIDRLKEDMEGKENNLEERDNTIAELRRQLEDEKRKELPKPTAADLIPDLDPWYVGSLERYITMLRSEAAEPQVQEKIKIFKAFVKAESDVRGIEFFDAPPQVSAVEPAASVQPEQGPKSRNNSNGSVTKPDLKVQVLPNATYEDDYDYSPGGRPIITRKPTFPAVEITQMQPQTAPSVQSTTILTPTSSIDDDTNKTPIQSHPEEPLPSQYKAYVPPNRSPEDPAPLRHRQTMSFLNTPSGASSIGLHKGHDEIFFGASQPNTQTSVNNPHHDEADNSVPPLNLKLHSQVSVAPPYEEDPNKYLAGSLPRQLQSQPSRRIQELRAKMSDTGNGLVKMEELAGTWEESASLNRRKNDDARRKRQEENEEHNDDLFNNDEISYAEMKRLEEEFKQKEVELKTHEVQEEYQSYIETVFNPLYNGLQAEIKGLMDLYAEAEHLLQTSVFGTKGLGGGDPPSTEDCLELLEDIHKQVEKRHEGVVHMVAERDRLYKKSEIQPLYVGGKIRAMKDLEKHFESAEKQAALNAKREKARRIGQLVSVAEDIIVNALSTERKEIDQILAAIKSLDDGAGDADTLSRAHVTLDALKHSSKAILSLFNNLEIELNNAVMDTEIAQAEIEKAGAAHLQQLQAEKKEEEKKLVEEYTRRVHVLESDAGEIKELVERKMRKSNGDTEKEKRLRTALEEAKRRNGHA